MLHYKKQASHSNRHCVISISDIDFRDRQLVISLKNPYSQTY